MSQERSFFDYLVGKEEIPDDIELAGYLERIRDRISLLIPANLIP